MKKRNLFVKLALLLVGAMLCFACESEEVMEVATSNDIPNVSGDTLIELSSGHVVFKNGNQYTWQGDILLTEGQVNLLDATGCPRQDSKVDYDKVSSNYYTIGRFDFNSIMLYGSYNDAAAINKSKPIITKKDGTTFSGQRTKLSDLDRRFPNRFYLPYIARSDTYYELDTVMFDENNVRLSKEQILKIQAQLNHGKTTPPPNGRIKNIF